MSKTTHQLPVLGSSEDEAVELAQPSPRSTARRSSAPAPIPSGSKKPRSPSAATTARVVGQSPSSRKRKQHIAPVTSYKKYSMHELFGTDSEDESEDRNNYDESRKSDKASPPLHEEPKKSKRCPDYARTSVTCPSSSSTAAVMPKKTSARDVFGSDSDDDVVDIPSGKKTAPIYSYFTKRVANGVSRQTDADKVGSHYIELKVYNCEEIKKVQPMNRWRHAIITVKNRTNDGTEAWTHLTEFIKATRKEFKDCRPDIINGT